MTTPNPTKCPKCTAVHDASVTCAEAWGHDASGMRDVVRDLINEGRAIEQSKRLRDKIREVIVDMRDRQGNILASGPQLPEVIEKIARAIEET